ncbi:MAG: carboxypeptidase-like regulatory domain-containing protein [Armatimonadota bacterium]
MKTKHITQTAAWMISACVAAVLLSHFAAGCGGGGAAAFGDAAGVVRDLANNAPIQGATVTIGGRSGVTGGNGSYYISSIRAGRSLVTCAASGYTPSGNLPEYDIAQGANQIPDIYLIPDSNQPPPPPPI